MKDSSNIIIYVGKSKNLKNRVKQYFYNGKKPSNKVEKLVKNIKNFEFILCDTEFEALLLENKLIKKYKPHYNRLLKNYEKYGYIKITKENFPKLDVCLNIEDDSLYFGPYANYYTALDAVNAINDNILIRSCKDKTFTKSFEGCLNYHLGKCLAPCRKNISKDTYEKELFKAINFLYSKDESILKSIKKTMEEASLDLDFDKAIKFRDDLKALNVILRETSFIINTLKLQKKVLVEKLENGYKLFFIIGYKVIHKEIVSLEFDIIKYYIEEKWKTLSCDDLDIKDYILKEELDEAEIVQCYLNREDKSVF
ncbi:excinuclease ABC subunit C [Clostridium pascui]|nr:excinuclease ABC subunit C [Clostridium pascui]